ncbi:MAG: hypothetical protein ABIH41_03800 [Nanoarchaeota archaeon]
MVHSLFLGALFGLALIVSLIAYVRVMVWRKTSGLPAPPWSWQLGYLVGMLVTPVIIVVLTMKISSWFAVFLVLDVVVNTIVSIRVTNMSRTEPVKP